MKYEMIKDCFCYIFFIFFIGNAHRTGNAYFDFMISVARGKPFFLISGRGGKFLWWFLCSFHFQR
jgi:hypothetical protein